MHHPIERMDLPLVAVRDLLHAPSHREDGPTIGSSEEEDDEEDEEVEKEVKKMLIMKKK